MQRRAAQLLQTRYTLPSMPCKITDFNDHISGNTVGSTLGGTGECRQKQINLSVKFPSARIRRSGRVKSQTVRGLACCSVGPNWDATEAISRALRRSRNLAIQRGLP